jgi:hypothetical protein
MLIKLALHSLAMALASMVLPVPGRTVEQDTFRRRHTIFEGLFGMLLELDLVQTTDIIPGDCWHFHNSLTQSGWVGSTNAKRKLSIVTPRESSTSASTVSSSRSTTDRRSIFSRICCIAASEQREAMSEPT